MKLETDLLSPTVASGIGFVPFGQGGDFRHNASQGGVRRLAIQGAAVTVFAQGVMLGVQMIATMVLARLLTPTDFGVITMVTTFSLLLGNCGLNGFTEAVVQREKMDHRLASNVFWIDLGVGAFLTLVFAAAGSVLARFYGDPRVAKVAIGMSGTIFLTSTAVTHLALLQRAMRFRLTSTNEAFSRILSVAVSIVLAWAHWGYWALVIGAIMQALSKSVGAWLLCRWFPTLPGRVSGTAETVRFALNVYGRFSFNYFSGNTDNLLVGWRLGASALGFYKKAFDLFALSANQLTSPLTNVAVSALSRLNARSMQYRDSLVSALSVLAFVGMGLSGELTLIGKDLISFLLGPGWEPAGRIFTFFGPGIGALMIYSTHGWIHLSIGKPDRWVRWGMIEVAVTCLLFFLGISLWGSDGVALAWTASYWVLAVPALWYAVNPMELRITCVLAALWRYPIASLAAGCACAVLRPSLVFAILPSGATERVVRIMTTSLLFGILYVSAVVLIHRGYAPLQQMTRLLREMMMLGKRTTRPALDQL
jgi:O-antigen/teichoic acid export membrane protein